MVHFVQQYSQIVVAPDGKKYVARAYAARHPGGLWDGWFVFFPLYHGRELATDRETTQSTLPAVAYWASGISSTYLEGALARARAHLPEVRLTRRAQQAGREEELARAEEKAYAEAAALARLEALDAEQRRRNAEELLLAERVVSARSVADLHERAAAAARAEAREAQRRRRQAERRQARAERRESSNLGHRAARAADFPSRRQASRHRTKRR
jgi:hypothetical protein